MGVFFYNIFLALFKAAMPLAALFSAKAAKWVQGRKSVFSRLETALAGHPKTVWMHCASLGEFEQGRPVLEKLRGRYPGYKFLLTFFSPSGYEVRKDYKGADWVFYLPMDGASNARRFLEIVNPSLVIFVKYDYWYYYLKKIKYRNIPLLLVSALFWEKMSFFKWYGALQRKMLSRFDHLFVQDETSSQLMDKVGLSSITSISGDTRFDRVVDIAEQAEPLPVIEVFAGSNRLIVAGSTWPEDEAVLKKVVGNLAGFSLKLIIAPHDINEKHLGTIKELFPDSVRFSAYSNSPGNYPTATTLVIDNIGLLSRLYRHAAIAYIGGGFGKGIHNTLEAAVYGKPVVFGPVYHKFKEASDLIRLSGAVSIANEQEAVDAVKDLLSNTGKYSLFCNSARSYVYAGRGATEKIIHYIQENRLLIS